MKSLKRIYESIINREQEIDDFKTINLQQEFDKLNRLLFDNKCEKIPLGFKSHKTRIGWVTLSLIRRNGKVVEVPNTLYISNTFKITYGTLMDTLAHEMIHVYLMQQGVREADHHGTAFMEMAKRINNKNLGIKVTATNTEILIRKNAPKKPYGIILVKIIGPRTITYWMTAISKIESIFENKDRVYKFIESYTPGKKTITILTSTDPQHSLYIHRTMQNKSRFEVIDESIYNSIINHNKVLETKVFQT